MKYKKQETVQDTTFSCLEELKCDIIENLLSTPDKYRSLAIIINIDSGEKLIRALFNSDVNGFKFRFHYDFEEEDLSQERLIILELDSDGYIWIEKAHENYFYETDFFYIDADINSFWLQKLDNGENDILIFDMDL